MSKRVKEDEKSEKIIRGLLRLPENRRCINCHSLGPQYICTTFLTFVCTNCSGIHREFTHRVKSVSMSKFNAEEVSALQAGGNERARQIYFKDWDPQRNSYPDGSNLQRLRDFIKHVYVDRRYTGERGSDRLPRLRLEETCERRKVGTCLEGFRSPGFERSSSERAPPGRKSESFKYYYYERRSSPRYVPENVRSGGYRRNPVRFEIVDDRFRDDGFGSGRRFSKGESMSGRRSLDSPANLDKSRSPEVRPVADLFGDNVPPQQAGENSKNKGKCSDGLAQKQNTELSLTVSSADGNSESLINPDTNPEPSAAVTTPQTPQVALPKADDKTPKASKMTTLEALLFELSPAIIPVRNTFEELISTNAPSTAPSGNMNAGVVEILSAPPSRQVSGIMCNDNASTTTSAVVALEQPPGACPPQTIPDCTEDSTMRGANGHQLPNVQQHQPFGSIDDIGDSAVGGPDSQQLPSTQQHKPSNSQDNSGNSTVKNPEGQQSPSMQQDLLSSSPATDDSAAMQLAITPVGNLFDQPRASSIAPNAETPRSSAVQSSQAVSKSVQDTRSTAGVQNPPVQTKSSGRKELPADLFTASYPSVPMPFQGWQTPAPHGMGSNMQYYPNKMPISAFQNSSKWTNPFDVNNGTTQDQTTEFPSMTPLQGALPNASPHAFSFGTPSSGLMASQAPSYASAIHQQSPFTAAVPSGAYMGQQQVHLNNRPFRQGTSGFGSNGAIYGSLDSPQQLTNGYQTPNTANSYPSKGRNPFE